MPSDSRRRDPRHRNTAVDSDEELSGEDQPRASRPPKKPQKPSNRTIIIAENVHITNGNFSLVDTGRDESLSQRSSTPTRNAPSLKSSRTKKRLTGRCDSRSAAEEDLENNSDDSEPENVPRANRRTAKLRGPSGEPRLHSEKKKGDQADEGYHTSGTAYTAESKRNPGKGKERSVSSSTGKSSSSQPQRSSSAESRKSEGVESDTDPPSHHSDPDKEVSENDEENDEDQNEENEDDEDEDDEDEDASDDDFANLPIQISNVDAQGNQAMSETAVLDTGTKSDWISHTFYEKLKKTLAVTRSELTERDTKKKYRDFNGTEFQPTFKVDLMIQSEEFKGLMKCRRLSFLVAKKATFMILMGVGTIRKEELMTRGKRESDGEGALAFIHGKLPDAESAQIKKKKEEQKKNAKEGKKIREAKIEESVKRKDNPNASSSKGAANLATSVSRSRTRSPVKTPKVSPTDSDSSIEGSW